jgi:formamidopyrimidine-DNA glycosylase
MPELPEVETIRIGLDSALRGEEVESVTVQDFLEVLDPPAPDAFTKALRGTEFVRAHRRGKYLLLDFTDNHTLIVHLRMTGQIHLLPVKDPPVRFERAAIQFKRNRSMRFADQRKFGRILLVDADASAELDSRLGVEPLSADFTSSRLQDVMRGRKKPVKALLLDQAMIAGIGNIYADEALFLARIHPLRPSGSITAEESGRLVAAVQNVLNSAIVNNGTTFSSYQDARGNEGKNQFSLNVYGKGRSHSPCPRCGTELVCIQAGGRSSHICEVCQILPQ